MFTLKVEFKRLLGYWLIIPMLVLACCEKSPTDLTNEVIPRDINNIAGLIVHQTPNSAISGLKNYSFQAFFYALLQATSDMPVSIGGEIFSGIHSELLKAQSDFVRLDKAYSNLGVFHSQWQNMATTKEQALASVANVMTQFRNSRSEAPNLGAENAWVPSSKDHLTVKVVHDRSRIHLAALFAIKLARSTSASDIRGLSLLAGESKCVQNAAAICRLTRILPTDYLASGFFVSPQRMITAAHCASPGVMLELDGRKIAPSKIDVHRGYLNGGITSGHDIAVLTFPKPIAPAVMPINFGFAASGTDVSFGGYSSGHLVCGKNVVTDPVAPEFDHMITLASPGGDMPKPGDSGGPIIVGNAAVGALSGGRGDSTNPDYAFFNSFAQNKDWIKSILEQPLPSSTPESI